MDKILIIKLGAIGDVLRTTGFLKGLYKKYNSAEIYWITEEISLPLLAKNQYIKRAITINQWNEIKNIEYALVLSLDDEENACKIATEAKKQKIIGAFIENGKRVYSKDSSEWFDMGLLGGPERDDLKKANEKTYQSILAKILGIEGEDLRPILNLDEKEFQEKFKAEQSISEKERLIGINTGAGGRWQYKKLEEEKTSKLIDAIYENHKIRSILLGGPEEAERNNRIREMCKSPLIDSGTGNNLMQFAAIIDLCDTLITSDSLAMHIGTALGKKVIAFFGPTSSAEIELFGKGKKIAPLMDCLVCYKRKCEFNPACMHLLTVDDFLEAIEEL